ncbi:UNVERIFIED_CONTAM: Transposon TX1 uncharacterized protein [Sesamum calycinum]|uniref:Transposon TX1 uncharacterized protein n=1 Tax=Sesamum calycinum TaxID=2727403 RepID=A0AAW2J7R1_9LAMI
MPIIPAEPDLKLKEKVQAAPVPEEIHPEPEVDRVSEDMPGYDRDKGKDIVLFNAFDLLRETDDEADGSSRGPNKCSPSEFGWPEPLERLDRLLVNDVWMDRWPNLYYTCLTPRTSDHSPLVLKGTVVICRLVYLKASKLEQVMLRQRAKLQWLKGGDQCSRIFFRRVATRRANKRDLLGGDRTARAIDLRYLRPWARHILSDDEARDIIRPVTIDEVKTAFFDIEEDKAPGPDGFSSGFFKAAWPVVGGEVSIAIMDFFKTGRLLKQVNATLLTLIPKVRTPHSVAEFRPISCCNVIYKVITKILVSRIRESLDLLISPSQNAFVPGRLISECPSCPRTLFGYNQCRLPPRCALKVDLRKAYDTVEWDFLIATLQMFGFPDMFIGWIEECVTSAHYSVVVNGGCMDSSRGHGSQTGRSHVPISFCSGHGSPSHDLAAAY